MLDSVGKVIDALGGVVKVATHCGVPVSTVGSWKARSSVPDEYRPTLVALAEDIGVGGVTYEALTLLHTKRPSEPAESLPPNN